MLRSVHVDMSFVCFHVHSTTTSGVFLKINSHFEMSEKMIYLTKISDTNFDIQYVLCSTEHYV